MIKYEVSCSILELTSDTSNLHIVTILDINGDS